LAPEKSTLVFPAQNQVCTQGAVVSATQSTITFKWNSAANAESYDLNLTNLFTGSTSTQTSNQAQMDITLARNTPYSWSIVSKSSKNTTTAQSDTWKFYNAGPGVVNYAPFPAEAVSPILGQTVTATGGKITLSWTGSDADNDIVSYDVYFGTTTTPALYQANVTAMSVANVTVTSGNTYYWKIITRDAQGNTSDAGIFSFKVN
jgi:hypothetical protein